jgi:hypothetical protein
LIAGGQDRTGWIYADPGDIGSALNRELVGCGHGRSSFPGSAPEFARLIIAGKIETIWLLEIGIGKRTIATLPRQ